MVGRSSDSKQTIFYGWPDRYSKTVCLDVN